MWWMPSFFRRARRRSGQLIFWLANAFDCLETLGEGGLPVIPVVRASSAIGNTVAQNHKRTVVPRNPSVDCADKIPVIGAATRQCRLADTIAGLHMRRGPAARVASNAATRLALLEIQRHSNIRLGGDFEVNRIRISNLTTWDRDRWRTIVERQLLQRRRVNPGHAGPSTSWQSNGRCCNRQITATKGVADLQADPLRIKSHVEGLAEGGITEDRTTSVLAQSDWSAYMAVYIQRQRFG